MFHLFVFEVHLYLSVGGLRSCVLKVDRLLRYLHCQTRYQILVLMVKEEEKTLTLPTDDSSDLGSSAFFRTILNPL
jgi:hypothetical protein